jgi:small-conductance mechanosensitive channel
MAIVSKSLRSISVACSGLLLVLCLSTAQAQLMPAAQLFNAATKPSKDTKAESKLTSLTGDQLSLRTPAEIDTQQSDMQARLDSAKSELAKAQKTLKDVALIDLATRQSLNDRISYLQAQADGYSQIVDALKDLRRLSDNLSQTQQEKDNWQPPAGAAPWHLATGDEVQLSMLQVQYQMQHLDQRLLILDQNIQELKNIRSQIDIDLRQASEKTEPASVSQVIPASRSAENAKRRLDLNNIEITLAVADKDTVMTERMAVSLRLATLKKVWKYYDNQFIFSDEDLSVMQADLDKQIVSLRKNELTVSSKINRTLDQARTAKSQLEQITQSSTASAEALTQAKNTLRMADIQAEAARMEREKYRALIDLVTIQMQLWKIRHDLYTPNQTAANFTIAKTQQLNLVHRLDQGQQYLTQMIAEKSQSSFNISEQLKAAQTPAEKAFLTSLMKPINEQIDNARSVYAEISRVKQLLLITSEEINSKESNRSLGQKLDALHSLVWAGAKTAWNYEIFAVDDSILVDGREVKLKRSITIGKSVGALAILIIGFMLITGLIKRTLALAVNKANLGASKSLVISRWLTLLAGVTLIISAFNLVEIPLSAFAFFGGALAIGVGFGTQNLLKNLISGVMLLIEKPIRIGDLVEIDGVTGIVTSIGIRFSTIHGGEGTDTLIPNSVLVEQKLVNWTYSTPDIRKELLVTVEATSDTQKVCEILLKITLEHTSVMRTPGPLVTLENFGDNGLVFKLQCWMKVQPNLNPSQVLSDLRLNLLKSFNEAGIKLPFPQRTVQFDQNNPIQVQLNQAEK